MNRYGEVGMRHQKIWAITITTAFVLISSVYSLSKDMENDLVSIANTAKKLQEIKVAPSETNVPPRAIRLLTDLKQKLRELVTIALNTSTEAGDDPANAKKMVINALDRQGIRVESPDDSDAPSHNQLPDNSCAYGSIYSITIDKPVHYADIIAVTVTIGINCGEDTSLWLFKKHNARWVCVFINQVDNYSDITTAQGNFDYKILPGAETGNFYVVTANITQWCSSWWRTIRYAIHEVVVGQDKPKILLSESDEIYIGVDPKFYTLTIDSNRLALKYHGGKLDGPLIGPPPLIAKVYEVMSGQVRQLRK
jgi:hypothetical protein